MVTTKRTTGLATGEFNIDEMTWEFHGVADGCDHHMTEYKGLKRH